MLKPYVSTNQKDWDEHVALVMMAYRSSIQSSTGYTPSMLHIGREIRLPVDIIFGNPEIDMAEKEQNKTNFIVNLEKQINRVHEIARKNLDIASHSMKTHYNVNLKFNSFKSGDNVWYYYPIRRKGLSPKFQRPWIGPCTDMIK
jgi:hypothetical protein